MKSFLGCTIVTILSLSLVKAGQLISNYNLISHHEVVHPQSHSIPSFGIVHPQYFSSFRTQPQRQVYAHPTVLATSVEESSVPHELKKSENFYNNPYIASALAKESLTFNKESVIYERPSEKIDRSQIVKLINNLNRAHYE
ncbi:unnamed protein product [Ceutorhynchus assimilis]|uniref:Uncharacterized protein n=1 Tax=Ceutorhynchus assimilis TaxID=467358 RepID=A0A9N9QGV7_9CUCU|nr:unnamed protein product [Ceutorhynchus assimilis]